MKYCCATMYWILLSVGCQIFRHFEEVVGYLSAILEIDTLFLPLEASRRGQRGFGEFRRILNKFG